MQPHPGRWRWNSPRWPEPLARCRTVLATRHSLGAEGTRVQPAGVGFFADGRRVVAGRLRTRPQRRTARTGCLRGSANRSALDRCCRGELTDSRRRFGAGERLISKRSSSLSGGARLVAVGRAVGAAGDRIAADGSRQVTAGRGTGADGGGAPTGSSGLRAHGKPTQSGRLRVGAYRHGVGIRGTGPGPERQGAGPVSLGISTAGKCIVTGCPGAGGLARNIAASLSRLGQIGAQPKQYDSDGNKANGVVHGAAQRGCGVKSIKRAPRTDRTTTLAFPQT